MASLSVVFDRLPLVAFLKNLCTVLCAEKGGDKYTRCPQHVSGEVWIFFWETVEGLKIFTNRNIIDKSFTK